MGKIYSERFWLSDKIGLYLLLLRGPMVMYLLLRIIFLLHIYNFNLFLKYNIMIIMSEFIIKKIKSTQFFFKEVNKMTKRLLAVKIAKS